MKKGNEEMKRDIFIKKTILLSAVFCLLLTISKIPTAYAETSSVVGFYIKEDEPRESLELYPDGTFYMQGKGKDGFTGRYKVVGKVVNLSLDFFGVARKGEIRGNILIIKNEAYRKIKRSKESWKFVAKSTDEEAFYVDTESIVSLSAGVVHHSGLDFPAKTSKLYSKYEAGGLRYKTFLQEIDCANNMVRSLKFSFFDKDGDLKGERKYSGEWEEIKSGTIPEEFKKTVCLR